MDSAARLEPDGGGGGSGGTLNEDSLNRALAEGRPEMIRLLRTAVRRRPLDKASGRRDPIGGRRQRGTPSAPTTAAAEGKKTPPDLATLDVDTLRIPRPLRAIVDHMKLVDVASYRERIYYFIGYCNSRHYAYATTIKYFYRLRQLGLFGPPTGPVSELRPNKRAFTDSGRPHQRVISMADYRQLFRYLLTNVTRETAPLLVAACTGLRSSEVLQFSLHTIAQLDRRLPVVDIKRKRTTIAAPAEDYHWRPVYTSLLGELVKCLRDELFAEECARYATQPINQRLFPVTQHTLGNRLAVVFRRVLNRNPPLGFGVHAFRNMLAMAMAADKASPQSIQYWLQHRNVRTTHSYIKADFSHMEAEFDRLTGAKYAPLRQTLTEAIALMDADRLKRPDK